MKTMVNGGASSVREIVEADFDAVISLLVRGFPRPRRYWEIRLERLRTRSTPPNLPRYGYLLEADGKSVGVILLISSLRRSGDHQEPLSNLSGWYVEPDFRSRATQLLRRALANKQTTYLNLYPATHVRPIMEAFGFRRYSEGQFLALLALAHNKRNTRASIIGVDRLHEIDLGASEQKRLEAQAAYGCITFCCTTDNETHPFVFVPRIIKGCIPCAQLAYCRQVTDLVEVAGTVGRYLLRYGRPFVLIDANGPIPSIPGKYFADVAPKYYKGEIIPALGDLTETEATIFGFPSKWFGAG
jgi:hypothetical protein